MYGSEFSARQQVEFIMACPLGLSVDGRENVLIQPFG